MSSVTGNAALQQADFVASKTLTTIFKSSVTTGSFLSIFPATDNHSWRLNSERFDQQHKTKQKKNRNKKNHGSHVNCKSVATGYDVWTILFFAPVLRKSLFSDI